MSNVRTIQIGDWIYAENVYGQFVKVVQITVKSSGGTSYIPEPERSKDENT